MISLEELYNKFKYKAIIKYNRTLFYKRNLKEICSLPEDSIILWGTPEYGNLGDQAITYAERAFLERVFPGRNIFCVTEKKCNDYILPFKRVEAKKKFIFVSPGGGNLGTLYKVQETCRQLLAKNIRHSKIIVFPQSTDYAEGTKGYKKAKKIYQHNKGLFLFARDQKSYEKMTKLFPKCRVGITPDIVASVKIEDDNSSNGLGVLCLLRNDSEANNGAKHSVDDLINYIGKDNCTFKDTCGQNYVCDIDDQKDQIEEFWSDLRSSKLVVTDRLHGMIFSLINHTPCIAFDNSTGKVSAFYKTWLGDCKSLKFCSEVNGDIRDFVDKCLNGEIDNKQFVDLDDKYDALKKALNE